jgi:hypothetical protein
MSFGSNSERPEQQSAPITKRSQSRCQAPPNKATVPLRPPSVDLVPITLIAPNEPNTHRPSRNEAKIPVRAVSFGSVPMLGPGAERTQRPGFPTHPPARRPASSSSRRSATSTACDHVNRLRMRLLAARPFRRASAGFATTCRIRCRSTATSGSASHG